MLSHCSLFGLECRRTTTREWHRSMIIERRNQLIQNIHQLTIYFLQALLEAYTRCVSIMGVDSKPTEVHYQIISNITKCFEVACNFENCKSKIIELPQLITDVCRVVYFKVNFIFSNFKISILFNCYSLFR